MKDYNRNTINSTYKINDIASCNLYNESSTSNSNINKNNNKNSANKELSNNFNFTPDIDLNFDNENDNIIHYNFDTFGNSNEFELENKNIQKSSKKHNKHNITNLNSIDFKNQSKRYLKDNSKKINQNFNNDNFYIENNNKASLFNKVGISNFSFTILNYKDLPELNANDYNQILYTYDKESLIDTLIRQKSLIQMKNWQIEMLNSKIKDKEDQITNCIKEAELNLRLQQIDNKKEISILENNFNNLVNDFNCLIETIDNSYSKTKYRDKYVLNKNIESTVEKVLKLKQENENLNSYNLVLLSFLDNFLCFFSKLNEYLLVNNPSNTVNNTLIGVNLVNKEFNNKLNDDFTLKVEDFNIMNFLNGDNFNTETEVIKKKDIREFDSSNYNYSINPTNLQKLKTKLIVYQRKIFELIKKANLMLNSQYNKLK